MNMLEMWIDEGRGNSALSAEVEAKKEPLNMLPKIRWPPKADAEVNETATTVPGEGKKFDSGKPDYTLLPFNALGGVVRVLGFGAVKYGRNNWQKVERIRYIAAAFRHLVALAKGELIDEESGESHASHLSCCSLFIGEMDARK